MWPAAGLPQLVGNGLDGEVQRPPQRVVLQLPWLPGEERALGEALVLREALDGIPLHTHTHTHRHTHEVCGSRFASDDGDGVPGDLHE